MTEFTEVASIAESIKEQITEGSGFWQPCSGCHETVDGYSPVPSSVIFGCPLGSGCSECGGIGAVWDDTDYADMANSMIEREKEAAILAAQPLPEGLTHDMIRVAINAHGGSAGDCEYEWMRDALKAALAARTNGQGGDGK